MSHPASGFPMVFRELKQRQRRRLVKNDFFTSEIRERLDLFNALMAVKTCSGLICNDSVQFQMEMRKISRLPRSVEGTELGHFTLWFRRRRQRNVQKVIKHVHSYCFAHYTARTDRCSAIRKIFYTTKIMRNFNISAFRGRNHR